MLRIFNLSLILTFTLGFIAFSYPPPDSCLKTFFIPTEEFYSNPYDVKVDSCQGSSTFLEYYGKLYYAIKFEYNIIPRYGVFPEDTIVEYNINDIDTIYSQAISDFQNLEAEFGTFKFMESVPEVHDTTALSPRTLFINLDNYANIDSVIERLKTFSCVESAHYNGWFEVISEIPTDAMLHPPTLLSTHKLSSSSSTDEWFPPNHHKQGWHWNHFSLKTPLAWEITFGKEEIHIGAMEVIDGTITHPDMTTNFKVLPYNDGNYQTEVLKAGHGLITMSCAIADQNNGYPLSGTAPDCSGFYKSTQSGVFYELLDVDGLTNGVITSPHVIYECAGYRNNPLNLMTNGVVALGAAGNGIGYKIINNENKYYPTYPYHMYENFEDPNYVGNIEKTLKVISVAGLSDGILLDKNCDVWNQGNGIIYSNWSGEDRFTSMKFHNFSEVESGRIFNFSIGNKKFSNNIAERDEAFVDIVVPADHIVNADYIEGSADWNIGTGTSQAVAMAAGVVGLMRSTNLNLSQNQNDYTQSINSDIHRTAYNIITFTADKIVDDGLIPDKIGDLEVSKYLNNSSYTENDGFLFQFNYLIQNLDILKRSWAQRVGFGRLNAYRSVAHSIRQKGLYEYAPVSTDYTIPIASVGGGSSSVGFTLPSGKKIMHWGSKVKEGTGDFEMDIDRGPTTGNDGILNVLEYGGVSMPDEFHNNQGVTKINNSSGSPARTAFKVPTNSILAIDGILTTDQNSLSHYVVTQGSGSSASKILAEGLVKDVEIFGNLRIGDITVTSTIDNGAGAIGFGIGFESEVYGIVNVNDFAYFYLLGNCTLQPGAIVNLNGDINCFTAASAELHMAHSTKIATTNNRRIEINDGTKLVIDENSVAELPLEVNVKNGGELVLEDNAKVKIKFLNVERGGLVSLNEGSLLALEEQEHYINGKLLINGGIENRATVTGYITEHCEPYDHEDYDAFKYIETTPIIYMQGDCDSLSLSQLDLQNVDFKDISLNAFNIPVYQTIRNTNFAVKSRESNPYYHFPYLFSLNFNNCEDCTNPFVQNIRFSNCTFKDYSQPTPPSNEPLNFNKLEYRAAGLSIEGYDQVEITGSDFSNLEYGVSTFDCNKVKIQTSNFDSCGIGDYNFASETYLCQNNYTVVKYGSVRDHSLEGRSYNNNYTKTLIGYKAISSDEQRFRGNNFNQYLNGISASCTELILSDVLEYGKYSLYGRNTFNISPILLNMDEYVNPFFRKNCLIGESADITLNKSCCGLSLRCGLNSFSENATYHIKYNGVGTFGPIDVNYNSFPDPMTFSYTPRTFGTTVTHGGMPNIDFKWEGSDSLCCGDWTLNPADYNCPPLVTHGTEVALCSPIQLLNIPYPMIIGKDFELENDYDDNHFKELNEWANSIDGNEIIKSYKIGKYNKVIKHEKSELFNLLSDYINDNIIDLSSYDTPYKTHPNILSSIDKKYNQIQSLSLLGFMDNLVGIDCQQSQTTNVKNDKFGITSLFIESLTPNPSNSIINISMTSSENIDLKINVVDQLGQNAKILFDNNLSIGTTTHSFDISQLSSGVYYLVFNWNKGSITKKIIISK